jgi:hypothetical protein
MRIIAIMVAVISAVVLISIPRGSATVKSQPGCPASGSAFQVDYFGFPLKSYWKCEITYEFTQGGGSVLYKAGSMFKTAVDAGLGLAVVLLPAFYITRGRS